MVGSRWEALYDNIICIPKYVANLMQGLGNIPIIENYKNVKVHVTFIQNRPRRPRGGVEV